MQLRGAGQISRHQATAGELVKFDRGGHQIARLHITGRFWRLLSASQQRRGNAHFGEQRFAVVDQPDAITVQQPNRRSAGFGQQRASTDDCAQRIDHDEHRRAHFHPLLASTRACHQLEQRQTRNVLTGDVAVRAVRNDTEQFQQARMREPSGEFERGRHLLQRALRDLPQHHDATGLAPRAEAPERDFAARAAEQLEQHLAFRLVLPRATRHERTLRTTAPNPRRGHESRITTLRRHAE